LTSAGAHTVHANSAAARGASDARPALVERRIYRASSTQERFIVGLLADALDEAIHRHAKRGGRVIDIGCGGQPLRPMLEATGMMYTGLDTQAQPGVRTDYLCAIDGALPDALLAAGGFDMVVCTEVLEHVADWPTAWANRARLLAPGGVLILSAPFFYPLHEEPFDFFRPTRHAVKHWAERSGLDIVEQRTLGNAWDVLGTAIAASGPKPASSWPHAWLSAAIARQMRKLVCWLIGTGIPARLVRTRDTLYLSNVAVLRRPGPNAPQDRGVEA
jgi:SAM-dependent methyltransferase